MQLKATWLRRLETGNQFVPLARNQMISGQICANLGTLGYVIAMRNVLWAKTVSSLTEDFSNILNMDQK